MNTTFQRRNHKNIKIILICIIVFSIIMIILFSYLYYKYLKSLPLIDYPTYTLSTTEWTNSNVTITVTSDSNKISAYSFNGGVDYQEDNTYEVLTNENFNIVVKDINGRESKSVLVVVKNIDKDPPTISFENTTTVQLGSKFSLRNGVAASDGEGSGLNSNYVVSPDTIDTNTIGEYTVTYTAFDKVGNYTEKTRTIVVSDIAGRTYYRYRTATVETYQCEPYLCNCATSEQLALTKTCPTSYTFNEPNQCCQTCYKTCRQTVWSDWSEWSQEKVTASSSKEVETKVE